MAGELPPIVGELKLSIDDLIAKLDDAKQKIADFSDSTGEAKVSVDTAEADEQLEDVKSKIEEIDATEGEATVTADTTEAEGKLDETQGRLDEIDATRADPVVDAETGEANAKIDETKAKLDELNANEANPRVNVHTSGSESSIAALSGKLLSFGALAPAVGAMVGGAFAALPGILSGVGAGFGSLMMGLHGITSALSAYRQATASAAQTGNEMAQMQLSNAQSLANASAQVESAQMQLSQTQVSAYDSVYQAQEQVVMSSQQLEAAQFAQRAAQVSLTEATMAAKFQLQNYKQQMADMALQVKQAQVNIEQAKLTLSETMGDPAATQIQRQQAKVSYEQAVQQLQDLQVQQKQLGEMAAYTASKGVAGSDQVVQAQQQVTSANYQVQNAQRSVHDSAMYLSQAQVAATQNVTMAQKQLTMAYYDQNVAIKQTALTMAMPIGANAALATSLAMLTPAGQQFVAWWHSQMTPIFMQMYGAAQSSLLPGLVKVLEAMKPYFMALIPIIQQFNQGFIQAAMPIAKFLSSAKGISELQITMKSGLGFMSLMGKAILDVIKGLGSLGTIAGPAVKTIGDAIVWAARQFMTWAASPAAVQLIHDFESVAAAIANVVGQIGAVGAIAALFALWKGPIALLVAFIPQLMPLAVPFIQLAGALLKVIDANAAPIITALVSSLVTLGPSLQGLMPFLTQLVIVLGQGLIQAVNAFIPIIREMASLLAGSLGQAIIYILSKLVPLAPYILAVVEALKLWAVVQGVLDILLNANPIGLVTLAIGLLTVAVLYLATHWQQVWTDIKQWMSDIQQWVGTAVNFIKAHWELILAILTGPFGLAVLFIKDHWNMIEQDTGNVVNAIANFFQSLPAKIMGFLSRLPGDFLALGSKLLHALVQGIASAPGAIMGAIGKAFTSGGGPLGKILGSVGGAIGSIFGAAEGGFVNKPMVGLVGEAGPEVILPLTNPARMAELMGSIAKPLPSYGGAMTGAATGNVAGVPGTAPPTMGNSNAPQVNVYAQTNADPHAIAAEVGWVLRTHK